MYNVYHKIKFLKETKRLSNVWPFITDLNTTIILNLSFGYEITILDFLDTHKFDNLFYFGKFRMYVQCTSYFFKDKSCNKHYNLNQYQVNSDYQILLIDIIYFRKAVAAG